MMATEESPLTAAELEAAYAKNTYTPPTPLPEAQASAKPTRHPLAGKTPGVRSTSRKALKIVKISADEATVLAVMRMRGESMCDREILDYCLKFTDKGDQWDINQITGRRNGLMTKGHIEEDARWKCDHSKSNVGVIHWKVTEAQS